MPAAEETVGASQAGVPNETRSIKAILGPPRLEGGLRNNFRNYPIWRSLDGMEEFRSLASLEGLRLIASTIIVADHYFRYVKLPTRGFHLAVDLFFVISGIVIAMVYDGHIHDFRSYLDFLRKRLARLYPLHLATFLFYIGIGFLMASGWTAAENPEKYNPSEIVPNLLMIHAWSPYGVISYNYVSWSISAEFFVYICFPFISFLIRGGVWIGFVLCIALLVLGIALSDYAVGTELTRLDWRLGALRALPSFTFGVWLWSYRLNLAKIVLLRNYASQATLMTMVAIIVLIVFYPADYAILACCYGLVACALISDITAAGTFASWKAISSRGYLTYSIYMLHTVVATIVISFVFPRIIGKSYAATVTAIVCSLMFTYIAAYASYWYFEKPLRSLARGSGPRGMSASKPEA